MTEPTLTDLLDELDGIAGQGNYSTEFFGQLVRSQWPRLSAALRELLAERETAEDVASDIEHEAGWLEDVHGKGVGIQTTVDRLRHAVARLRAEREGGDG